MLSQDEDLSYYVAKTTCKNIIESNFNIRSATICKNDGTIICTEHRPGKKSLALHSEGQVSLIRASGRFFNRKMHEKIFGPITYSLTLHEKIARIAVPINEKYVALISADRNTNHSDLIMTDIYPAIQSAKL
jgi:hypothetical protein